MSEYRGEIYKYERNRLETFQTWPANAKVEAWKMAKAGLLYTGQEEEVRCFSCNCVLSQWQYGDQVMTRHRLASPDCPFVKDQSDNVPCLPQGGDIPPEDPGTTPLSSPGSPHLTDDAGPREVRWGGGSLRQTSRHSPEGPTEVDYKSEAARLSSFTNWSVAFIAPSDLAKAGFYSLDPSGQEDGCKCAFCHNCVGDWVEGDDPMSEHRALFPLCRFVQGHEVGNLPLESTGEMTETTVGQDETGIRWNSPHREPNSVSEKASNTASLLGREDCGVMKHVGPLHPQHATLEARLRTFRDWPPALKQQPAQLSEAGFYYIGLSDQVKCFYCDGGLRNWQPEDVPWVEHARWFSQCVFVRLVKGDKFISQCLVERPPEKTGLSSEKPGPVTEEEIRKAMSQAIVKQVLSMGIDHSRVKMAIKRKLEANGGAPFSSVENLIAAAFSVQRNQERRTREENLNPVGAVLEGMSSFGRVREEERGVDQWGAGEMLGGGIIVQQMEEISREEENSNTISLSRPEGQLQSLPSTPVAVGEGNCNSPSFSRGGEEGEPSCTSLPLPEQEKEESPTDLLTENTRLKEQRTCKICMDGEVGVVFLPCGHLCCCVNCAPSLKDCPVCRTNIQGTVRTFLS